MRRIAVIIEELEIRIGANIQDALSGMDKVQQRMAKLCAQMGKSLAPKLQGAAGAAAKPILNASQGAEKVAAAAKATMSGAVQSAEELDKIVARAVARMKETQKGGHYQQTKTPMKDYHPSDGLATPVVNKANQSKNLEQTLVRMAELKVRQEQAAQAVQSSAARVKEALSQMAQAAGEAAGLTASKMENLSQRIAVQKEKIEQLYGQLQGAVSRSGLQSAETAKVQEQILKEENALIGLIEKYNKAADSARKLTAAQQQAGQAGQEVSPRSPVSNEELDESIRKLNEIRRQAEEINRNNSGSPPQGGGGSWLESLRKRLSKIWAGIVQGASKVSETLGRVKSNTDRAERSVRRYGRSAKTAAGKASTAFSRLGAIIKNTLIVGTLYRAFRGLFTFLRDGIRSAINAPEIENMFRVALGNMAEEAAAFAKQFKKALGVDEYATKEQLGTYMNMIRTMGIGQQTAYKMSRSLTILANDMASLYNVPVQQAFENLQSAMSGQSRAVRKYGYVLSESMLKETAYRNGIAATGAELTEQQKTLARYYALLEQSTAAQGDLARTSATLGNQLRMLKSNITAAGRSIGEAFLPFLQAVVPWLNAFAIVLQRAGNALARFTYGLFGMDYDAEKKKQEQIIGGIGDIAGAEEEAGDAAEEAGKKAEASVLGFDQLNKLQAPSAASGGTDTGGGGGGVEIPGIPELDIPDGESPYEKLADKIQAAFKKVLEALGPTIEALKALWEQLKIVGGFAWDNLVNFYENFLKPVGQWVLGENGLPRLIYLIAETLAEIEWQKINDSLARFYTELAKLTIFTGTKLIDFYALCLKPLTVWTLSEAFPRFVDLTTNALASLDYDRISASMDRLFVAMNRIGQVVITGALDFYEHFLIPVGLWTMNEALPRLMDVLSQIVENINWENLLAHLRDFWDALAKFTTDTIGEGLLWILENVLEPLAEWTGNELLPAFLDALKAVLESSVWRSAGQALVNLYNNFLKPVASWTGGILLSVLEWISQHGDTVAKLILSIGAGFVTWKVILGLDKAAEIILKIISAIMTAGGIGPIVAVIGTMATVFVQLSDISPVLKAALMGVTGAVTALGIAMKTGFSKFSAILTGINLGVQIFTKLNQVTPNLSIAIGVLTAALTAGAIAWKVFWDGATLGLAEIASLVIAGIAAIGTAITSFTNKSLPEIKRFADDVSEETKTILNPIMDLSDKASKELLELFAKAEPLTKDNTAKISGYFKDMADSITSELDKMKNAAIESLAALFGEEAVSYEENLAKTNSFYDNKIAELDRYDEELENSIREAKLKYGEDTEACAQAVAEAKKLNDQKIADAGYTREKIEQERKREIDSLKENASETAKCYIEMREDTANHYDEKSKIIQEKTAEANEIKRTALLENRELTKEEYETINRLQEEMLQQGITDLSANAKEAASILETRKEDLTAISAQECQQILENAAKQRDGQIKAAEETYEQALKSAQQLRKDGTQESAEMAKEIIEKAGEAKEGQIQAAKDTYQGVLDTIKDSRPDVLKEVDETTGKIKSNWDQFWDGLKKGWDDFWSGITNSKPPSVEAPKRSKSSKGRESEPRFYSAAPMEVPALASGAVLRKPTLNLAGEYAGAANNPEIVSPQSLMQETFMESLYPLTSTFHQDILFLAQVVRDSKIEISGDASDMLKLLQRSANAYQKRTGKPAF